jgi:hypothetical protein
MKVEVPIILFICVIVAMLIIAAYGFWTGAWEPPPQ